MGEDDGGKVEETAIETTGVLLPPLPAAVEFRGAPPRLAAVGDMKCLSCIGTVGGFDGGGGAGGS